MSVLSLLSTRRFAPFFATQFLGAFNDNVFKNALVVVLTFRAAQWTTLDAGILANLAGGVFILPFFLFSASAGQLADKFDKAMLARAVKGLEMAIMLVAGVGFFWHSLPVLFAALFLLGLHSTLFGPVKYALMPQHLAADELVVGNALVEAGTFVAILLGTLAGGLIAAADVAPLWIAVAGGAIAALGYLCSRGIPAAPAPAPSLRFNPNPFSETWRNIGFARQERRVFLAILGISWFWLYGALFLAQMPALAKNVLGGDEGVVTLLLAIFTAGIGTGSFLCERYSRRQLELALVPLGALGLTLFGLDLALSLPGFQFAAPMAAPTPNPIAAAPVSVGELLSPAGLTHTGIGRTMFDLLALGVFGGLFIVPLYVVMQVASDPAHRARIVAANNIFNALFMVAGALGAAALLAAGVGLPQLFALAALANALAALGFFVRAPEYLRRVRDCWARR
ncbi:MFS transporter [Rhodocyclus tenuis]|uniref:MFS transporter n=2 Tax=Rhodocyclus TaxID=1064 RepID=A0A6L5K0U9_RHOTE|nr:MFS transporter [Rhodocyclus gracilis]MQY52470.1 MFS transporter [Rhodocyclus gracilis]NJA88607.1 MFS transporter [Rhodocyclus gracilis]